MSFDTGARQLGKVGRNEPCPCESGKKWKRCHGDPQLVREWTYDHPALSAVWTSRAADEAWARVAFRRAWDDAEAKGLLPKGAAFTDGKVAS
jgi:hypothetical protein